MGIGTPKTAFRQPARTTPRVVFERGRRTRTARSAAGENRARCHNRQAPTRLIVVTIVTRLWRRPEPVSETGIPTVRTCRAIGGVVTVSVGLIRTSHTPFLPAPTEGCAGVETRTANSPRNRNPLRGSETRDARCCVSKGETVLYGSPGDGGAYYRGTRVGGSRGLNTGSTARMTSARRPTADEEYERRAENGEGTARRKTVRDCQSRIGAVLIVD